MSGREGATDEAVQRLVDKGLLVGPEHGLRGPWPERSRIVTKPREASGNCRPGDRTSWWPDGPICDAPHLVLAPVLMGWTVECNQYVPGPGPGDFLHYWATLDEALDDIEDFYFAKPSRVWVHYDLLLRNATKELRAAPRVWDADGEFRAHFRERFATEASDIERMMAEGRIPARYQAAATEALRAIHEVLRLR